MDNIKWYLVILCSWLGHVVIAQSDHIDPSWEEINPSSLSPNGDWAIFRKSSQSGGDTTYLLHTKSMQQLKWAQTAIRFIDDNWATVSNPEGQTLISLATGKARPMESNNPLHVIDSPDYRLEKNGNDLVFTDRQGGNVFKLEEVGQFVLDAKMERMLVTQQKEDLTILSIVDVRSFRQDTVWTEPRINILKMSWSDDGQACVFTKKDEASGEVLFHYALARKKITQVAMRFPKGMYTYSITPTFIGQTHDLSILFRATFLSADSASEFVDVWAGNERQFFRNAYPDARFTSKTQTYYWTVSSAHALQVDDSIRYVESALGNQGRFLLVDPSTDRNFRQHAGYIRLYVKNMHDNTLKFLADSIVHTSEQLKISPNGEWVAYRRDDGKYHDHHFGAYPITVQNTITGEAMEIACPDVQGKLAWSADERYLVLLNRQGMWTWDTQTRSLKLYYSIGEVPQTIDILNQKYGASVIDLEQPLLIHAVNLNDNYNQLVRLINGVEDVLVESRPDRIARTVFTPDCRTVLYTIENFNLPFVLQLSRTGETPQTIMQSNTHIEQMPFFKQEILTYTNRHQQSLKGTLYYPKNFDPAKSYPMVVHIYESQYYLANRFKYPHLRNPTGFNAALLAQEGYFVYEPDIVYNEEGPGLSALDCVSAALKAAFRIEQIDPERVGLIGQSFGSYQTNFVIGQTDQFAAAVSGNGMADAVMSYYSYNYNYHIPAFSRYETGQYRMFSPYYLAKEKYRSNSPIEYVHQIKTPLLLWAGRQDLNVPWKQTENFYTALRRFNAPQMALFYKEEGHIIINQKAQEHLTRSVLDWFSYYLKDNREIKWIQQGTTSY